jgi:hypothetical protein
MTGIARVTRALLIGIGLVLAVWLLGAVMEAARLLLNSEKCGILNG